MQTETKTHNNSVRPFIDFMIYCATDSKIAIVGVYKKRRNDLSQLGELWKMQI